MSDLMISSITVAIVLGLALGMSYWANRAKTDRSAYVGLYLVFGIPGVLLLVAGAAFAVSGSRDGVTLLLLGLALTLPLVKQFRIYLARVTPLDPTSPIDLCGLGLVLFVVSILSVAFLATPGPTDETVSVTLPDLLVQVVAFVGLAFILTGALVYRSWSGVMKRLDLTRFSLVGLAAAAGAVVVAFVLQIVAGVLTQAFQPGIVDDLERVTQDMTANVQNPLGAVLLGLCAGIGEEFLLRGAIQPRFGIVLTSLLFALMHVQYGLTFTLVALFGIGILFGLVKNRYGTWAAVISHAVFNALVVMIYTVAN
jgi:membrane protease YdiL (CAAX protease family)